MSGRGDSNLLLRIISCICERRQRRERGPNDAYLERTVRPNPPPPRTTVYLHQWQAGRASRVSYCSSNKSVGWHAARTLYDTGACFLYFSNQFSLRYDTVPCYTARCRHIGMTDGGCAPAINTKPQRFIIPCTKQVCTKQAYSDVSCRKTNRVQK